MRFGEELKGERESRGISLDEVSVSTRVSVRHLQALEDERFKELPGGVFNRGIVRSYARVCGLDPEVTVQKFLAAMRANGMEPEGKEDDWVEFAEAIHRSRERSPKRRWRWLGVLAILLATLALAAGALWVLVHRGIVHLPEKKRILAILHTSS